MATHKKNILLYFFSVSYVVCSHSSFLIALKPRVWLFEATPGRLNDHIENTKGFCLRSIKYLVMDEADRILDMDFEVEVDKILAVLPKQRSTFLFSATMTKKVCSKFLFNQYLEITVLYNSPNVGVAYFTYQTVVIEVLVFPYLILSSLCSTTGSFITLSVNCCSGRSTSISLTEHQLCSMCTNVPVLCTRVNCLNIVGRWPSFRGHRYRIQSKLKCLINTKP